MAAVKETVLYYNPRKTDKVRLLKSVLVRMGIRIRNVEASQIHRKVGELAGIKGFEKSAEKAGEPEESLQERETVSIPEEMMVLHNFTERRLDELLLQLRKAKIPPVALKAVVTESNCRWSFYELYKEIRAEHEKLRGEQEAAE